MDTVGAIVSRFFTFTVTAAERAFPAASYAFTVSVCDPLALVRLFHEKLNAGNVPVIDRTPSTENSSSFTPMLSDDVPVTATVPHTVAPAKGALMDTVGAVVSVTLFTFTVTAAERKFPAASYAFTVSVCDPLALVRLFHEKLNAGDVPAAVRMPSTENSSFFTATLSVDVPVTATVPHTEAPDNGALMDTVGAVVSLLPPLAANTVL